TMEATEAMQDTGNGHEPGPRGTRNGETITLASHRPSGGEHRTVCLCEDLPRRLEKQSTGARQPHPPFRAIEQPDLDLFLQLFDLLTERRLRHMETLGRATEMQLFSDGDEVPQM